MVSFQCSFGSTDLCLNNATCKLFTFETIDANGTAVNASNGEFTCECPEGWIHDNAFFHFPACTMPQPTYLAFIIYYSFVAFTLVFFLVREFWTIRHGKTRRIALTNVLVLILTWCQAISCYFQDGAFEGNAVFTALGFPLMFYLGGKLSISFMETLHAVRRTPVSKLREALRICVIISGAVAFVLGLAMIGTCRGSNATYNTIVWVVEVWLMFWVTVFSSLVAVFTTLLLGNVTHASTLRGATGENRRAIRELIAKIRIIRNAALFNSIIIGLVSIPKMVGFLVLGSVPYQWVFAYVVLYHGLVVVSFGILMFVRHTSNARKQRKGQQEGRDDNSSPFGDTDPDGHVGPIDPRKHKEHGLHNDGKNGRTWLFRGSSLMTKQGNKDITRMTHDQDNNFMGSPQLTNGQKVINGSPRHKRVLDG